MCVIKYSKLVNFEGREDSVDKFYMKLPADVSFIIDRMNSHGYSAHVVGGSVRDSLIGRELGDFDITTSATPSETKTVFSDRKTVDTGIKHGTVTLVLGGVPYEITTYRVDGDYKDNRHPDQVTFTDRIDEDLARRDFTVNAMAYDPHIGLIDPFFGTEDARARIIRAVGDPYVRFDEDALRILRALRFASVLGFEIETTTDRAARELSARLGSISKERVYTELKKLIMGKNAVEILTSYSDVLSLVLDGLKITSLPSAECFDTADYYSRLASVFLLNSDDPVSKADDTLSLLKTDKFTRTHVTSVLKAYYSASFDERTSVLTALALNGEEAVRGALDLGALVGRYGVCERDLLTDTLRCGIPYKISGLAVRGGDLLSLGISGERVGETLKELLFTVIEGRVENTTEDIIRYLKRGE
jgi:tRNA nucleotidyltransferase (CCA-adding enzyme)